MGRTGSFMVGGALLAAAISKELIIFHGETVVVLAFGGVLYGLYSKVGPSLSAHLDSYSKSIYDEIAAGRNVLSQNIEDRISILRQEISSVEISKELMEIGKEVSVLQVELGRRLAQDQLASDVKRHLGALVSLENQVRLSEQAAIVELLEKNILKNYTAEQDSLVVKQCIESLATMKA
eukprot:Sdes_comp18925_c0_seq1m9392